MIHVRSFPAKRNWIDNRQCQGSLAAFDLNRDFFALYELPSFAA